MTLTELLNATFITRQELYNWFNKIKDYEEFSPNFIKPNNRFICLAFPPIKKSSIIIPDGLSVERTEDTHNWVLGFTNNNEVIAALIPKFGHVKVPGRDGMFLVNMDEICMRYGVCIRHLAALIPEGN